MVRFVPLLVAASLVVGGCTCRASGRMPCTPGLANFGKVDDGLYRSAQPTTEGMRSARALGIRTVVNLRAERSDAAELGGEGLAGVSIPTRQWSLGEEDLRAFLAVAIDPTRRPVLVHCAEGRDRTGVCVAAYRMVVEGWTLDEARREMRAYGAMPWYVNLDRLLRRLDLEAMAADLMRRRLDADLGHTPVPAAHPVAVPPIAAPATPLRTPTSDP